MSEITFLTPLRKKLPRRMVELIFGKRMVEPFLYALNIAMDTNSSTFGILS